MRADIDLAERRPADAVASLQQAVALEDSLTYDEPHLWLAPTRHALGAALLAANRNGEAERTYREDLAHYPENGWSLIGLARSLRAQGRNEAAKDVDRRFRGRVVATRTCASTARGSSCAQRAFSALLG